MGRLTTHVLDTVRGCPGAGIRIELFRVLEQRLEPVAQALTNFDGRCDEPLLQGSAYRSGTYQLHFHAGAYWLGQPGHATGDSAAGFLDEVVVRFVLDERQAHYHVPLLLSPFAYSTYRGS
ncbi:hydroxyisourate hydrolase [Pseudomonas sp. v388]|uniref:hydroxyisourate hydrolase n=1 Tax=Pseudomonas sp. v388 TaxID=2479849 RepID=UPI000F77F97E|nr:hydroxyisourate hydrolase [Pseudomonas sp. v388]RRV05623.1 hydroxyisourate hydrolase [Pseudomonas sp. v388]